MARNLSISALSFYSCLWEMFRTTAPFRRVPPADSHLRRASARVGGDGFFLAYANI
jgi:hypothetical protein